MRRKKGFTLIELLVVIAIIAMLLAILIPSLQTVKQMAQGTVCMANLRGLSMSFYLYAEDNDSKLARSNQAPDRWVDDPIDVSGASIGSANAASTVEDEERGIMNGTMFPYTDTVKVYHCAGDKRYKQNTVSGGKGAYRSFAMPDTIGNINNQGEPVEYTVASVLTSAQYNIKALIKYNEFKTPSDKYIFVEENYTHTGSNTSGPYTAGYNGGVWSFWHQDQYESWWDPLAPWHNDRTNLGYADGHAQKLVWRDERTVWFARDRFDPRLGTDKASCATHTNPVNPDQQYMSRAYPRAQ